MRKSENIFKILCWLSLIVIAGCSERITNKSEHQIVSLMTQSASLNWTMINVDGDAHIIRMKDGKAILIDTGSSSTAESSLIPYIKACSIDKIHMVFISHPHSDHYGGLIPLLFSDISIGSVLFNIPSNSRCDSEPWGCNSKDLEAIQETLIKLNIPLYNVEAGMNIFLSVDTDLEILYAYNLTNSPVGYIDINDESLIMLLMHKNHRFLFTGDMNYRIGSYLAENGLNLQADILKIPHHGTSSLAPNNLFEKINPQYAIVPSGRELWCSANSAQTRNWINEKSITTDISGFHGNTNISILNDELMLATQYHNTVICK